tara:strand:+ start:1517 stop:1849 length:333 start_codon:yes stop_codon:yes gene_type:complete
MKRLIDDKGATVALLYNLIWGKADITHARFNECIYELYAPIAEWYDKLNPYDTDTWVPCFVSNNDSRSREAMAWVVDYDRKFPSPFNTGGGSYYLYATPVDLNIRYKGEE